MMLIHLLVVLAALVLLLAVVGLVAAVERAWVWLLESGRGPVRTAAKV